MNGVTAYETLSRDLEGERARPLDRELRRLSSWPMPPVGRLPLKREKGTTNWSWISLSSCSSPIESIMCEDN
jgi:hypothetical protein